jgi:hypothetical protein
MQQTKQLFSAMRLFGVTLFVLVAHAHRAAADPSVYEPSSDPAVGFNLIEWYNFPSGGEAVWENAVQQIHDAGFREVSISPVRFVDITTGHILPTSPKGPELSQIEAAVVKAKSLSMRVTLNPFVEMMNPHSVADPGDDEYFAPFNGCGWRGCLNLTEGTPANTQFWNDYQGYLGEVAAIAQAHNVDAMTIGTEYKALNQDSAQNNHWTSVISAVDSVYHGKLGYAANWDSYNDSNVASTIWDNSAIDFIGIDSYFSYGADALTGYIQSQHPGIDANTALQMAIDAANASGTYPNQTFIDLMTAAWNHKLDSEILPYAAARKGGGGMPVEFTEVGNLPFNLAALDPQQQFLTQTFGSQPLDAAEQKMVFEGLVRALDGRKSLFPAMDIWQWDIPGSGGSQWNITTSTNPSPDQPSNVPLGDWLSDYVKTGVPEPSTLGLAVLGFAGLAMTKFKRRSTLGEHFAITASSPLG